MDRGDYEVEQETPEGQDGEVREGLAVLDAPAEVMVDADIDQDEKPSEQGEDGKEDAEEQQSPRGKQPRCLESMGRVERIGPQSEGVAAFASHRCGGWRMNKNDSDAVRMTVYKA